MVGFDMYPLQSSTIIGVHFMTDTRRWYEVSQG